MEILTFIQAYETVGSKGTTFWFKLRDQYCGDGPITVLVPCMEGCKKTGVMVEQKMWKVYPDKDNAEFFLVPDDVALQGIEEIPPHMKSLKKWYQDKYWFYPVGDMVKMNRELYGIEVHGKLEHNGELMYKMIQEVSPTGKAPKFNAACNEYSLEKVGITEDNDNVYIIKR